MGEDGSWAWTGHRRGRVMGGRRVLGARNVDTLVRGHGRGWGSAGIFNTRGLGSCTQGPSTIARTQSCAHGRPSRPAHQPPRPAHQPSRPASAARVGGGGRGVVQRLQPSSGDACEAATLRQSPPESVAPACPGRPASARSIGRPGPADIRGMIRPSRIRPVPLPRPLPPYCGHSAAAAAEASPRRRPRRRRRSCHWRRPGRHCSGGVGWTRLKASSL